MLCYYSLMLMSSSLLQLQLEKLLHFVELHLLHISAYNYMSAEIIICIMTRLQPRCHNLIYLIPE